VSEAGRKSDTYLRFSDQPRVNAEVAELARAQHGVFALGQLLELGLTARTVQRRTAVGRLHRVHRGVYSLAPTALLSLEGRWLAAVLACGQGAVLSHRSAAALHELRADKRARIEVTTPGRAARSHAGVDVHRSSTLTAADATVVSGIPVTTVARTQLDMAEVIGRRGLERVFDQAEILEVFDLRALESQLERNRYRPCAGVVRVVLDEHYAGRTPTWSELEERFLTLTRGGGLPDPEVNTWIATDEREPAVRVDFLWRRERLIVETDGHRTHRTRQAFERDRRRDQRLVLAGWRVIRVTWRQLTREPMQVADTLARLLAA
jgi:predicted transcriptional regulator of viral defense system